MQKNSIPPPLPACTLKCFLNYKNISTSKILNKTLFYSDLPNIEACMHKRNLKFIFIWKKINLFRTEPYIKRKIPQTALKFIVYTINTPPEHEKYKSALNIHISPPANPASWTGLREFRQNIKLLSSITPFAGILMKIRE